MEKQDGQTISEWITGFIKDNMALVVHEDEDVARLKIELQILECKVVAHSTEKDGLEKEITDFNQRTNLELGELTAKYLKLKAALKQKEAEETDEPKEKNENKKRQKKQRENLKAMRKVMLNLNRNLCYLNYQMRIKKN
jgi:hypothetical protein